MNVREEMEEDEMIEGGGDEKGERSCFRARIMCWEWWDGWDDSQGQALRHEKTRGRRTSRLETMVVLQEQYLKAIGTIFLMMECLWKVMCLRRRRRRRRRRPFAIPSDRHAPGTILLLKEEDSSRNSLLWFPIGHVQTAKDGIRTTNQFWWCGLEVESCREKKVYQRGSKPKNKLTKRSAGFSRRHQLS
jgi:hypothetical protein